MRGSGEFVEAQIFQINRQVPMQNRDVTRYGSPAGLQKILQ